MKSLITIILGLGLLFGLTGVALADAGFGGSVEAGFAYVSGEGLGFSLDAELDFFYEDYFLDDAFSLSLEFDLVEETLISESDNSTQLWIQGEVELFYHPVESLALGVIYEGTDRTYLAIGPFTSITIDGMWFAGYYDFEVGGVGFYLTYPLGVMGDFYLENDSMMLDLACLAVDLQTGSIPMDGVIDPIWLITASYRSDRFRIEGEVVLPNWVWQDYGVYTSVGLRATYGDEESFTIGAAVDYDIDDGFIDTIMFDLTWGGFYAEAGWLFGADPLYYLQAGYDFDENVGLWAEAGYGAVSGDYYALGGVSVQF